MQPVRSPHNIKDQTIRLGFFSCGNILLHRGGHIRFQAVQYIQISFHNIFCKINSLCLRKQINLMNKLPEKVPALPFLLYSACAYTVIEPACPLG